MSEAGLWSPERRALTGGLVLTITFVAAEALAILLVMPTVKEDLDGLALYGWVFSAFMLGQLVGTVLAGRAVDRMGPAAPYMAGLVLFVAGLLIGGLAPTMFVLVVGRAVQGLGAGTITPVAYVSIGRSLPESLRPRMMAVLSTAWVIPGLFAPVIAAVVTHAFGWRWVFLGLVPLVLVAGPIALPALRRLGPPGGEPTPSNVVDAVRVATGAVLLLAGLTSHALYGLVLVVAGAWLGVPALRRLVPAGTLTARPGLPATILSRGLLTFAFFGTDTYMQLVVQDVRDRGRGPATAALTAATLAWTAGSWVQARQAPRRESRQFVGTGVLFVLVGIGAVAAVLSPAIPVWMVVVAWTLGGFGMGLAYAPVTLIVLREAPPGQEGAVTASLTLLDTLGWALGTGLGGAAVAAGEAAGWPLETGVGIALGLAGAAAVAALFVSPRLPRNLPTAGVPEPHPGIV
jgi:MFS family permease